MGQQLSAGELVFLGQKEGRPLSTMALEMVLRRMKVDATVHGFRSAFRDWAAEQTSVSREVAEAALAHTLENKVEAAYRRTDLFEKRRVLMEQWAKHCEPPRMNGGDLPRKEDQQGPRREKQMKQKAVNAVSTGNSCFQSKFKKSCGKR